MFYSHSHMNTDTIRSRSCNELQREKTDAKMPEKTLQCLGTREQMFKLLRVSHSTLRFSVGGCVRVLGQLFAAVYCLSLEMLNICSLV